MFKKVVKSCLVVSVIISMFLVFGYMDTHYNREAEVVSVEPTTETVIFEDECGYTWEFFSSQYKVGDRVSMLMYNKGTDSIIFDDIIEKVSKKG